MWFSARRQAEQSAQSQGHDVRTEHFAPRRRRDRERDEQPHNGEDQVFGRSAHVKSRKRSEFLVFFAYFSNYYFKQKRFTSSGGGFNRKTIPVWWPGQIIFENYFHPLNVNNA